MSKPKARHFAFLLYPDSMPEDWKLKLEMIGKPMAVSPLHDKDKTERRSEDAIRKEAKRRAEAQCGKIPDQVARAVKLAEAREYWTGIVRSEEANKAEYKKAHYHVLYVNENPVTSESVRNKLQRALGKQAVAHVEIVDNIEGSFLYLTHESKDAIAKGKHVYDKKDIVLLNNFDIDRYVVLDKGQKTEVLMILKRVIKENMIANILDLDTFLQEHGAEYGLDNELQVMGVIRENVSYIKLYLDGAYHKARWMWEKEQRGR